MRAIMAAVVVMGVLIIAGVATIVVTIVHRSAGGSMPATTQQTLLDEPDGTHIAGLSAAGDRVALQLQGGGPDRVLVMDASSGQVLLRARLTR